MESFHARKVHCLNLNNDSTDWWWEWKLGWICCTIPELLHPVFSVGHLLHREFCKKTLYATTDTFCLTIDEKRALRSDVETVLLVYSTVYNHRVAGYTSTAVCSTGANPTTGFSSAGKPACDQYLQPIVTPLISVFCQEGVLLAFRIQ